RFADTSIARNKDHLPLAAQCLSEILFQPRKADLAADKLTVEVGVGVGDCIGTRFSALLAHWSDETVSSLERSLNEERLICIVSQRFTQLEYVFLNDFWIDIGLGPKGFKDLILRDELLGSVDKVPQHVERFGR